MRIFVHDGQQRVVFVHAADHVVPAEFAAADVLRAQEGAVNVGIVFFDGGQSQIAVAYRPALVGQQRQAQQAGGSVVQRLAQTPQAVVPFDMDLAETVLVPAGQRADNPAVTPRDADVADGQPAQPPVVPVGRFIMRRKLAADGFAVEEIGQFAFFSRTAEAEFHPLRCNRAARAGKADERRVHQALRDVVRHTAAVGGDGGEGGGVVVQNHAGVQRQRVGGNDVAQFAVGPEKAAAGTVAAVEAQVGQVAQCFPFAVEIGGTAEAAAQDRDFARFGIAAFVNFRLIALNR